MQRELRLWHHLITLSGKLGDVPKLDLTMKPKLSKLGGASAPRTTSLLPVNPLPPPPGPLGSSAQHPGRGLARSPMLPPPLPAAPSQTTRRSTAALRPLALGPFHFRPALRRSPITWRSREGPAPEALAGAPWPRPPAAASAAASSFPSSSGRGETAGPEGRRRRRDGARVGRPRRSARTAALERRAAPRAGAEARAGEAVRGGEERPPAAPQEVPRR